MMEHTDLRIEINTILSETIQRMTKGGPEDTIRLVEELSGKIIEAAASKDDALMTITMARVSLLGERWRVEATIEMWYAVGRIMRAVFAIAKEALL